MASDDNSGGSNTSLLTVTLAPGTIYHVQVGSGTGSASGTIMKLNYSAVSLVGGMVDPMVLVGGLWLAGSRAAQGPHHRGRDALPGG